MLSWQALSQQLQEIVNTFIRFLKARRREEATIGVAAILILTGYSIAKWLPNPLPDFIGSWYGHLIIPGLFYLAGLCFLFYGSYRLWQLVYTPELPPAINSPSAIKGPLAFTEADGELFRKLGREDDLRKLLGYIEDDQVRLVVLMGSSGAGKTSLLRAGLKDILKDTGSSVTIGKLSQPTRDASYCGRFKKAGAPGRTMTPTNRINLIPARLIVR